VQAELDSKASWLSSEALKDARAQLPILYVEALPVRTDASGKVIQIGLLLRAMPDGSISRALVSGRVLHGEMVRDALIRHLEKDLGNLALPLLPSSTLPVSVSEYFPDPEISGLHDPRQHAVALSYLIPVQGDCAPSQASLDLAWLTPTEAISERTASEMTGGQHKVLVTLLAFAGVI
jgi:ADP-ribose pyrophosphatase YjhB (NUDIX family)